MYDSCLALFGPSSYYTYPVSNYFTVLIAVFASSFVGFVIGRHLSTLTVPYSAIISKNAACLNKSLSTFFFPLLISLTTPLLILLACLLPVGRYTYFIYSVIFAPFGSLTRFVLSLAFNFNPNFPYGTLLANVFGSYIYLGMVAINAYDHSLSFLAMQIVTSMIQGYCGCLTTVSTFILELDSMKKRRYMYTYFIATVLPIQIVYIILGHFFSSLCS
jgi:CrcB protein